MATKTDGEGTAKAGGWRVIPSESQWSISWRMLRRNPVGLFGLVGLISLLLVTLAAPLIAPYEPDRMDYDALLVPPGAAHPWGTDDLGRDVLSRVIWGGQESLRVAVLAISIAFVGATTLGLISGYFGGKTDAIMQRIAEIFMAFPTILLMLSIVAALGPSLTTVLIALGISFIPGPSRVVRASVLSVKNCEYVTAARVIGATHPRIMLRHVLPNIMAPIIVYTTLGLGAAIMATAGLSYVGLGAQPPSPEWGAMLNYGRSYLRDAWWMSVFPGLGIFASVLCVNLLGDGLRDALDPRLRA